MFFSKRKDQPVKKSKTEVERTSEEVKAELGRRSTKLKRVREALNRIQDTEREEQQAAPAFALALVRSKR